ncbi:MAG: HDIG domain-containing protein [Bacteroidaceae bacterium]|nr:HDIG domain-containing protein [Bacteroidaceae bacterium]
MQFKFLKRIKRKTLNEVLVKTSIVLVSTLLIVYFMPRGDKFSYDYSVDKPWRYGQLIATFKFPIYKEEAVIRHEQDSVMREFQPYYNMDEEVGKGVLRNLYTVKLNEWKFPGAALYIRHVAALLDTIYSHGVLSTEDYAEVQAGAAGSVRIVKGNEAALVHASSLFTTRSAYEYIMHADTLKFSRIVMQDLNLDELLSVNLQYDKAKSEAAKADLLSSISGASGMVQSGQKIIDRGEIVTKETYNILKSYEREVSKHAVTDTHVSYTVIGQTVFVCVLLITLLSYIQLFRSDYFDNLRSCILLFALLVFFCMVASWMVSHKFMHVFMLPCCMVPIIIRVFMDSRTAFMFHCAMIAIISLTLKSPFEFLLLQLVTGMISIQSLRELSQRSQIVRTAAFIALAYMTFFTAYECIVENDYAKIDTTYYIYFFINGVLLLFTYPLLYLLEKGFGFISDVTLVELSNINNPLLQRMSEIAPGTFQHSMQVANLASEVARKIGAKAQLVRTGALYHDIGKLEHTAYFTENQTGRSPHSRLTPQKSASAIIEHVKRGLNLADKYNLPPSIKRFIATHHGRGMVKYFYVTYKNEHPDEDVDTSIFTYPGPNPESKEEAILMMVDSVEAASRSLSEYTEESISALVDKIIDAQVTDGFFAECAITFKDIATTKAVLKDKLKTIYHTRISYPELQDPATPNAQ